MGFQSFAKLVGLDYYFGKTAYGNEMDSDGIWYEPFYNFLSKK